MSVPSRRRSFAVAVALVFGLVVHAILALFVWYPLRSGATPLWTMRGQTHDFFIAPFEGNLELRPGQTMKLVAMAKGDHEWPGREVASAFNRWSVTPAHAVEVNRWTGVLRVLPEAKHGSRYTVHGKLGFRGIPVERSLLVYTLEENPLVGYWRSEQRRDGAIWFEAGGEFAVAMRPRIESMVDYWGTYRFDRQTGALQLLPRTPGDVPRDADLTGTFRIENGNRLFLDGMYLGTFDDGPRVTEETFRR